MCIPRSGRAACGRCNDFSAALSRQNVLRSFLVDGGRLLLQLSSNAFGMRRHGSRIDSRSPDVRCDRTDRLGYVRLCHLPLLALLCALCQEERTAAEAEPARLTMPRSVSQKPLSRSRLGAAARLCSCVNRMLSMMTLKLSSMLMFVFPSNITCWFLAIRHAVRSVPPLSSARLEA